MISTKPKKCFTIRIIWITYHLNPLLLNSTLPINENAPNAPIWNALIILMNQNQTTILQGNRACTNMVTFLENNHWICDSNTNIPYLASILPIVYGTADKTASNGFIFTNYLQFYTTLCSPPPLGQFTSIVRDILLQS